MNRQDGPLLVRGLGLQLPLYDYVSNVATDTTDTYTFKLGGSGGTTVCVVAVVYTDDTKGTLETVTRTPTLPWNS